MSASRADAVTVCALAATAFVAACVAHEALGHGGACLALAGEIRLLSSVYFRCVPAGSFVDAAGPSMNLLVAAVLAAVLAAWRTPSTGRVLLAFLVAYNGFWGAGYLVYSALSNAGDWAYVLRDLPAEARWVWRLAMGAFGLGLYLCVLWVAGRSLPRGRPLVIAYAVTGIVAGASALFYTGATLPAVQEAAKEGFLAPVGLLLVALRPGAGDIPLARSRAAQVLAALLVLAFWLTLGRGFRGA